MGRFADHSLRTASQLPNIKTHAMSRFSPTCNPWFHVKPIAPTVYLSMANKPPDRLTCSGEIEIKSGRHARPCELFHVKHLHLNDAQEALARSVQQARTIVPSPAEVQSKAWRHAGAESRLNILRMPSAAPPSPARHARRGAELIRTPKSQTDPEPPMPVSTTKNRARRQVRPLEVQPNVN